jgi:hypothetical protein
MGAEDIAVVALGRWLNMGAWCSGGTGLSALECQSGVFQAFGYHFLILDVGTNAQNRWPHAASTWATPEASALLPQCRGTPVLRCTL